MQADIETLDKIKEDLHEDEKHFEKLDHEIREKYNMLNSHNENHE
jgi:DNA-binding MltR family transcriptional regulator